MWFKIVPKKTIVELIEAESPAAAMEDFAWKMDQDMNAYFMAVPAFDTEVEILEGESDE